MIFALFKRLRPARRENIAGTLIASANAARDTHRFDVAAALYLEALRFGPDNPHIRVQAANMLKDSGSYAEAREQYLLALQMLPDNADLAMQMGHLYKLTGETERARGSYRRALDLQPGSKDAERELLNLSVPSTSLEDRDQAGLIRALLPASMGVPTLGPNELRLFRYGRRAGREPNNYKVLQGVEAIRGFWTALTRVDQIRLSLDGDEIANERPATFDRSYRRRPFFKHVFNFWYDFSPVAPGPHALEIEFLDEQGELLFRHSETLHVRPPLSEQDGAISDAWVPSISPHEDVAETINSRPSIIRSVARRLLPEPLRTILVQRVDQLGDLACSVPAIWRLRDLFPDARLIGLVTPANRELASSLALFDEVLTIDFAERVEEGRRVLDAQGQRKLRKMLAPYEVDVAIDLGEGDDSRPLLLLSGARFLYGFRARQFPWLDAGLDFGSRDPVNHNDVVPPSRKFTLLVEGLGALRNSQPAPRPNPDRSGLAEMGIAAGEKYVVIHSGARLFFSRWPHFDTLARMIVERLDMKVVLLSPDSATSPTNQPDTRLRLVSGQMPFAQLDGLLSHCSLFVGNDSGPKHLAALRGAQVLSIHIPRNNWTEWGQEISGTIITRRVPCAGCGIAPDGEDCGKDYACIRSVEAEEVFREVSALLAAAN